MEHLKCPGCHGVLERKTYVDIVTDECSKCGGVWLEKGEMGIVATGSSSDEESAAASHVVGPNAQKDRPCPRCPKQAMVKTMLWECSDVELDHCQKCKGFFFDKGEIQAMNKELQELNPEKGDAEFRGMMKGLWVRVDKCVGVSLQKGKKSGVSTLMDHGIKITAYFSKPLGIGLQMYPESRGAKILKLLRMFKGTDVQTGDQKLDKTFIIQAVSEDSAKEVFTPYFRAPIRNFVHGSPKIQDTPGELRVFDNRVEYKEGGCSDSIRYDVNEDPAGIVRGLLDIAMEAKV